MFLITLGNIEFSGIADIIQIPFGFLMDLFYQLTNSYGWALILFALAVRIVLIPMTAKSKKSSMKMSRLQPQVQYLQKKYANDQQKLSQEMQALYKAEGVSMGGGCLWSLLPLLLLFPLYTVVREPITYMLHQPEAVVTKILEIMKIGEDAFAQMIAAPQLEKFSTELAAAGITGLQNISFDFLLIDLSQKPIIPFTANWAWDWPHIGLFLIPLLSAGSQILSMIISQKINNSLVTNEKGVEDKETAKNSQVNQTTKVMMYTMPLMSLFIGFSYPAALSLYWLFSGLFTTVIDVIMTKHYRKIYDAEDASKLRIAMEEEQAALEKERIRAERRAANPDGITQNTSKKKLQQNKQKEQQAEKAAAQIEYEKKKGTYVEQPDNSPKPISGIADRPFCKGRAYQADRYEKTEE